jgi:hypothetical protein
MTMIAGRKTCQPSATFTRPANTTQYAADELIANSGTAGSVVAMEFTDFMDRNQRSGCIRRAKIHKSNTTNTTAIFTLWLFSASPGVANGDNGAFVPSVVTGYLGKLSCVAADFISGTAGAAAWLDPDVGQEINFQLTGPQTNVSLYGLLSTGPGGTYTPASGEVFTVTLDAHVD